MINSEEGRFILTQDFSSWFPIAFGLVTRKHIMVIACHGGSCSLHGGQKAKREKEEGLGS
jgi:hypothetical protein